MNDNSHTFDDPGELDNYYRDQVIPVMNSLREAVDTLEPVVGDEWWPVPSYNKILYYA